MDRLWGPLVGFASRTLSGYGDPEAAVQEAFVRVWARRASLKTTGSVRALLYTIVRNLCLDELRRRERQTRADSEGPTPSAPRTPYEDVHGAELKRLAAAAVAGLPPKRREVFRLVREEGLSYKEVAEALDLSPQTVANHMSLAMADLRATLRPYLPGQDSTDAEGSADGPDQSSSRS
jgi:RNA polymerase sigma-70 factor (ECF subfamily)